MVAVASGGIFNSAGTGSTFVCPVLTTVAYPDDYAVWLPFDLPALTTNERIRGVVVPERLYYMPTAGLAANPATRLPPQMVERLRATIKSIFD